MSFLKRLFGLGDGGAAAPVDPGKTLEHGGYLIRATPYKEAGQYQLCGVITKVIDGETKEHRFVRADRFTDVEAATDITFAKAKLIIAEQGDQIFAPRA